MFVFSVFLSKSQGVVNIYPVFYDQYLSGLSVINPSASGLEHNYEFNIGNQRLLGNFNKLSSNNFIFNKRLKTFQDNHYPFSSAGLMVSNDKEGQYINRGRFYFQYAWHARLTNKFFFSGGLKLGGVNYLVKGTPLSGDGSDYSVDGGVGLSLYSKSFYLGLSSDQVFNAELQPLDEITVLAPFILINTFKKVKINEVLNIVPSFVQRVTIDKNYKSENITGINLKCELKNKIAFTGGVKSKYGIIFLTEILNLGFGKGDLSFGLSYVIPVTKSVLNISLLEFNAKYLLNKL